MPGWRNLVLLAASLCLVAADVCAATLKAVQSGTAISNANGVLTVPITSVDPTKAFLIFRTRHDSHRPVGSMVRGRIASATTLEFERVTDKGNPVPMSVLGYVAAREQLG